MSPAPVDLGPPSGKPPGKGPPGKPGAPGAPGPGGGLDWLKTKEGKVVAGGAVVLLVIVLALRKGAGTGGTMSADALQTGPDMTLQDRLDQIGFRGGTLEEWISATTGLSGQVEKLTDLLGDQDKVNEPATPPTSAEAQRQRNELTGVLSRYWHWREGLQVGRRAAIAGGRQAEAARYHEEIKKTEGLITETRRKLIGLGTT